MSLLSAMLLEFVSNLHSDDSFIIKIILIKKGQIETIQQKDVPMFRYSALNRRRKYHKLSFLSIMVTEDLVYGIRLAGCWHRTFIKRSPYRQGGMKEPV